MAGGLQPLRATVPFQLQQRRGGGDRAGNGGRRRAPAVCGLGAARESSAPGAVLGPRTSTVSRCPGSSGTPRGRTALSRAGCSGGFSLLLRGWKRKSETRGSGGGTDPPRRHRQLPSVRWCHKNPCPLFCAADPA